ncbi:MAG: hypothetical protein RQ833_11530 [Sphingomonadaceae bacterium]|nr:hypothetical protein [Sphingomonadaceae bacterium]
MPKTNLQTAFAALLRAAFLAPAGQVTDALAAAARALGDRLDEEGHPALAAAARGFASEIAAPAETDTAQEK